MKQYNIEYRRTHAKKIAKQKQKAGGRSSKRITSHTSENTSDISLTTGSRAYYKRNRDEILARKRLYRRSHFKKVSAGI